MSTIFEFVRRTYQAQGGVAEAQIEVWERKHNLRLPEDYRRFLLATNGGTLRPYTFDIVATDPAIPEKVHALAYLFDWDEAQEQSQEDIIPGSRTAPPDRLAIGITESELVIMLRLDQTQYGAVDAWVRNLFESWGEGSNTVLVPLAQSFNDFMSMLRDDTAHETYHTYWPNHDSKNKVAMRLPWP